MVKVYRPDGVEEEKDAVDARECVKHCGYTYEPVIEGEESLEPENPESTDPTEPQKKGGARPVKR